jgi:DNA polymerase III delta subunit
MTLSLVGSNRFLLKRRLDELTQTFIAEHSDLALERLDAEEVDGQRVFDAVQSLPFLASKKMFVLC